MFYDEMDNPKPLTKSEVNRLLKVVVVCGSFITAVIIIF